MTDLGLLAIASLAGGALLGGMASGLAGFAFGATTLGIYAHAVPPALIPPLIVLGSLAVQLMVMPMLWRQLDWRAALPFVLGGIAGVPFGVLLLDLLSAKAFRLAAGILLITYATTTLLAGRLPQMRLESTPLDAAIGWLGGVLGGFAGLSGVVPTIWCSMRRWTKERQRSVFQLFNTAMHITALIGYGLAGHLTDEVGELAAIVVPAGCVGGVIGFRLYRRIDDRAFARVLLILLGVSGVTLVAPHL